MKWVQTSREECGQPLENPRETPKELFLYITRYVFCYWDKRLHTWAKSQVDCKHILLQYVTVWQGATLSPLSVTINSPGGRLSMPENWSFILLLATNQSSRSSELEDGAPALWRDNQPTNQCQKNSSSTVSCETGMEKPTCSRTEAWPWILACIWARGAQTQLEKDSTFNHKTNFFFKPHKLIVSKRSKN